MALWPSSDPDGTPDMTWAKVLHSSELGLLLIVNKVVCLGVRASLIKSQEYQTQSQIRLNAVQTKTYHIFEEDGEPILHRAEGTDIDWKAGKNPTVKVSTT